MADLLNSAYGAFSYIYSLFAGEEEIDEGLEKVQCSGVNCGKQTTTKLQCPTCLKNNVSTYYCSQYCFKRNWSNHKNIHPQDGSATYDPFPESCYKGSVRACYPLSPRRPIDESVELPDYAKDGNPRSEKILSFFRVQVLSEESIQEMRHVCKIGRLVLDAAASIIKPGVTTDEIDKAVHQECMKYKAYPSPLNYYNFPKSVCTSVNEIICHGIPDQRPLEDGDIVNLDISIYLNGHHADLNETYYVGDKARQDKDTVRLVETTREALDKAIATVKPGVLFRSFGDVIEQHATENDLSVVRTYRGHGINTLFHCAPIIPHYAKNKAAGAAKAGITFTIEPMLNLGTCKDVTWPDKWTSSTADGKKSAQFEHTLLVTEDGVEVLTARLPNSPGGPVPRID